MKPVAIPSPSESVVKKASESIEVTDSLGRKIVVRRPLLSSQLDLMVVVGPDASKNDMYMAMMNVLLHVVSIGGDPAPALVKKSDIDDFVNTLGNEGVETVTKAISDHFTQSFTVDEVKKKSES